jgi:hypothetical protein
MPWPLQSGQTVGGFHGSETPSVEAFGKWLVENWLTVVIFLLGLAATYIAYRWSRKDRIPSYAIIHFNVIDKSGGLFPSLRVGYHGHGEDLEVFSVTRVYVWNAGDETIRKTDVAKNDPIRISVANGVIVAAAVIHRTREINQFDCVSKRDKTVVELSFEFLDRDDGAIIQVCHSARNESDIAIRGTVLGAKKWQVVRLQYLTYPDVLPVSQRGARTGVYPMKRLVATWLLAIGYFLFLISFAPSFVGSPLREAARVVCWIIASLCIFGAFWIRRRKVPASLARHERVTQM